jgi:CTD small phosphatase-like protein 2
MKPLSQSFDFGSGPTIHIKDLRVITNRGLNNVLLVGNATYAFGFQLKNGVPIVPFYNEADD